MEYSNVILHHSLTEKSVGFIDKENKIVFIVNPDATKAEIKNAVEKTFNVKVDKVNVMRTTKSTKKAFVKLHKDSKAEEVATALGIV